MNYIGVKMLEVNEVSIVVKNNCDVFTEKIDPVTPGAKRCLTLYFFFTIQF